MADDNSSLQHEIILYATPDGAVRVEVVFADETFWLSQKKMAELFGVESHTITYHLKEIYKSGELKDLATTRKIRVVQPEGGRGVARGILLYNLDAIIAVGYRVNSRQATQFRIWATQVLRDYLIKGFVLDDERLKQGKRFGKDYFDELLERIRSIRASERLDYAENQASRQIPMRMADWVEKLDAFLQFNEYDVLKNAGKVSHEVAKELAEKQYEAFNIVQDRTFESDFERATKKLLGQKQATQKKKKS